MKRTLKHTRVVHAALTALVAILALGAPSQAQETGQPSNEPLLIALKEAPPFVFKDEAGEWTGIAVDLWTAMAERLDRQYEYRETTLPELLDGVEAETFDVGVGALTVTAEREVRLDFSQPYFTAGLGVAADPQSHNWTTFARNVFSTAFLKALAALCVALAAAGIAVWVFERKRNAEQFGGTPAQGIGHGFWWAAVTMTTVGYGDKSPVTFAGRVVGLIWMFVAILTISGFTAAIASTLTAESLEGRIESPDDLRSARIATVADTASAVYLDELGLTYNTFPDVTGALQAVADGGADAAVHDRPLLAYEARQGFVGQVQVALWYLTRQGYAFALPTDSPLAEDIDRALLEVVDSDAWKEIRQRYLGKQ